MGKHEQKYHIVSGVPMPACREMPMLPGEIIHGGTNGCGRSFFRPITTKNGVLGCPKCGKPLDETTKAKLKNG
jgi:hypothetical protein